MTFTRGPVEGMTVTPGLPGLHQTRNAQLAVAAWAALARRGTAWRFPPAAVARGLEQVAANTGIRGRMEVLVTPGGRWILDVGHNPDGIGTLVDALRAQRLRTAVVVFGVMADKAWTTMLELLRPLGPCMVAVAPRMERALPVLDLARGARTAGFEVTSASSVAAGIRRARKLAGAGDVLVAGSHYVVAEALASLENR